MPKKAARPYSDSKIYDLEAEFESNKDNLSILCALLVELKDRKNRRRNIALAENIRKAIEAVSCKAPKKNPVTPSIRKTPHHGGNDEVITELTNGLSVADAKKEIIRRFRQNVKGKRNKGSGNARHDGREGHWLERQMGVKPNSKNEPDLLGFEMKNDSTSGKTTFGDWSPDKSIWGDNRTDLAIRKFDRDTEFLEFFGEPNPEKENRKSWSGAVVPKIGDFNRFGQRLFVSSHGDICAEYSFERDCREHKAHLVPWPFRIRKSVILAQWNRGSIKDKVEKKFNQNGWFKCLKNKNGIYEKIVFGAPIDYRRWLHFVEKGVIYFDCGMHQGNNRPYCNWRANDGFWKSLIIEEYE